MIQIVAAPMRQMKTYSMLLGILIGSFDAFVLLMGTFADIHILSPQAVLGINAVLGFLIVPAKLILQNIPATTEQKTAIVEAAAAQPIEEGHPNVKVKVDEVVVPNNPVDAKELK